jgi:serine protease Do
VETVQPGGPAEEAGVKPEDIILAIGGKAVKNGDELVAKVADTTIGEKLTITVDRSGKKMDLAITVKDRTEVFKERFARARNEEAEPKDEGSEAKFGIYVRNLSPEERDEMKLETGKGVLVTRVQEESFAGEVGLRENDVIVSINRQPVASADDIRKIQGTLKPGDAVAFRVMRPNPLPGRGPKFGSFFLSGTLPK